MPRGFRLFAYLFPNVVRALISGPSTVKYPFGPVEVPEGYRGRIRIRADKCRGCGLCVRDCPAAALELEREGRDKFRLIWYPDRCAYCGQCEESCRFGAIYQTAEFVPGTDRPAELATVLVDRKPHDTDEG